MIENRLMKIGMISWSNVEITAQMLLLLPMRIIIKPTLPPSLGTCATTTTTTAILKKKNNDAIVYHVVYHYADARGWKLVFGGRKCVKKKKRRRFA